MVTGGDDAPRTSTRRLVAAVLRRPATRRIVIVFACFRAVEMGSWIAVTTLAYQFGGVKEASAVLVAQLAPSVVAATSVGSIAERFGWARTLGTGMGIQAVALAAVAVLVAADAPHLAIYAVTIVAAVSMVAARPTIAALLPRVAGSPRELTAANAVLGWADGTASLLGPVITAVAIGVVGLGAPFVAFAAIGGFGSLTAFRLRAADREHATGEDDPQPTFLEALAEAARSPGTRSSLTVLAAHSFVLGAVDLLFVLIAIDVLGGPAADAGWMSVAFGVGALFGGTASVLLVARRELWPAIVGAGLVMAAGLTVVGLAATPWTAALVFAVCGAGTALLLVATRTLLQRVADLEVLCHTFAVAEAAQMAMLLLGALVVPLLVAWLSAEWAGAGVAVVMLVALAITVGGLTRSERAVHAPLARIELLAHVPVFELLTAPSLETVARFAHPRHLHAGETVIRQGDVGEQFYVVVEGAVSVIKDGHEVNRLGPGDGFGELALLHDIPRTATVVATIGSEVLSIDRETFTVALRGQVGPVRGDR